MLVVLAVLAPIYGRFVFAFFLCILPFCIVEGHCAAKKCFDFCHCVDELVLTHNY
jgi:hypothetical protein